MVSCMIVETPPNNRWEYIIDKVPLTLSIDLEGAQTHHSRIPSSGVTDAPGTTLVLELSSI
jgi:hypothetical protein